MVSVFLAASLLAVGATPAEGVLIGVTSPEGKLATFFVDAKGATALGRGLAVPRKGGFWVLDVSDGEVEQAWARPAKEGAPPWWGKPPPAPERPDVLEDGGTGALSDAGACQTSNHIQVRFASPELFTLSEHGSSDCGGRPAQTTLVNAFTFDDAPEAKGDFRAKRASIDVLGKTARHALMLAAGEEQQKDRCLANPADSEWLIVRSDGAWGLMGHVGARDSTCRGAESSFDVDFTLPPNVVGMGMPVNREKFLAEDKDFGDALASPSGRMVVILQNKRILVRVNGRQAAQTPLSSGHPNLGIVMAQWTSGQKNVDWLKATAAKALKP